MELHIGVIGAGGFAGFAIKAFLKVPGIKVAAVMDINRMAAVQMGAELGLKVYDEFEQLLGNNNINLIYIATPPYLHYAQSMKALLAGKHVICEKPAALKTSEAEELVALARSRKLLYIVNLMQRYNPLYQTVKTIVQENILGNFLHGYFENYASDQNLGLDHWFWDKTKSGGIFIEHGVHFFDLFAGWLGEGKIVGAWHLLRPHLKEPIIDRVQATVLYNGGLVNFYHGFDQPEILDRQEMRLLFERGEITLYGWVPVKMKLHGLLYKGQLENLQELMGSCSIVHHNHNDQDPAGHKVKGRFVEVIFEDHITIKYENNLGKQNLYCQMLTAMITDQWNWIRDHNHVRVIDGKNAVLSTRMAEDATRIAQKIEYQERN
jgi:predicted dehydrogenase